MSTGQLPSAWLAEDDALLLTALEVVAEQRRARQEPQI